MKKTSQLFAILCVIAALICFAASDEHITFGGVGIIFLLLADRYNNMTIN